MQGGDSGQEEGIARLAPAPGEDPVGFVVSQRAFSDVVATLQSPERPVEVELCRHGGQAAQEAAIGGGEGLLVQPKLTEEQRVALFEQEEPFLCQAAHHAPADLVRVSHLPLAAVGEAVPVELEDQLPGEGELHRLLGEEAQVLVVVQAGEDHQNVGIRRVHRLCASLHISAARGSFAEERWRRVAEGFGKFRAEPVPVGEVLARASELVPEAHGHDGARPIEERRHQRKPPQPLAGVEELVAEEAIAVELAAAPLRLADLIVQDDHDIVPG